MTKHSAEMSSGEETRLGTQARARLSTGWGDRSSPQDQGNVRSDKGSAVLGELSGVQCHTEASPGARLSESFIPPLTQQTLVIRLLCADTVPGPVALH